MKFLILFFMSTLSSLAAATEMMTLNLWQTLNNEQKELLISGIGLESYDGIQQLSLSAKNSHQTVTNNYFKNYANKMHDFMFANVDFDIQGNHATIAAPYLFWLDILFIDESTVLGGQVGIIQDGCDLSLDVNYPAHFITKEEAMAAGCEVSDVSWQANGYFDENAIPIEYNDTLIWSGY